MPARDFYHRVVRDALIRDGWTITAEPVTLVYGIRSLYVDLGAQFLFGADRDGRKIVVEVKSFRGHSEMADLETALGQYVLYRAILRELDPGSSLYLALPIIPYRSIFLDELGELLIREERLSLIVFDPSTGAIEQWID